MTEAPRQAIAHISTQYAKPIFAFALNHTNKRQDAEDLAQEIMLQIVRSMTSRAVIQSMDAYIWTVSKYVWVNWVRRQVQSSQYVELNGTLELLPDADHDPLGVLLNAELEGLLRREIAFLSETQRRVVTMFYYHEMKQIDIAHALQIPVGTVKWHLHAAKNELRKGMERMRKPGELSFNPIKLVNMGHCGQPGKIGETNDFLKRSLTQNIAYAAYFQTKSIEELAEELGTPPPFIKDEVQYLVEYGFMDEVEPGRYQTNFIIWHRGGNGSEKHELYKECAEVIADLHFDAIVAARDQIHETGIYYPDTDFNFLLWTLLPLDIEWQAGQCGALSLNQEAVTIRKDGGRYIAFTHLYRPHKHSTASNGKLGYYSTCGPMIRSNESLYLYQLNTYWSERDGWRSLTMRDIELCHAFQTGALPEDDAHKEDYAFLLAKDYITKADSGYKFNTVWVANPDCMQRLKSALPNLAHLYAPVVRRLYEKGLEITLRNMPEHIKPQVDYMVRINSLGGALVPYVLRLLVDQGRLHEPTPEQRKTITTLMGVV